jgi:ATP-dependent RNA helicase HelY
VLPNATVAARVARLEALATQLNALEQRHRVPATRSPDAGFAATAWAWASGQELHTVLDDDLTGGDFVRTVRQLADLLRQLAQVAPSPATAEAARTAGGTLARGVVLSAGSLE